MPHLLHANSTRASKENIKLLLSLGQEESFSARVANLLFPCANIFGH